MIFLKKLYSNYSILQYSDPHISVSFNNIVIEKDINVSDKNNLYILLFLNLYNTPHREEKSLLIFVKIWTK